MAKASDNEPAITTQEYGPITAREYGRLEERVDSIIREVSKGNADVAARIDILGKAFESASTKQGERIGALELANTTRDLVLTAEKAERGAERRMLFALLALFQLIAMTALGAWIKGFWGP